MKMKHLLSAVKTQKKRFQLLMVEKEELEKECIEKQYEKEREEIRTKKMLVQIKEKQKKQYNQICAMHQESVKALNQKYTQLQEKQKQEENGSKTGICYGRWSAK